MKKKVLSLLTFTMVMTFGVTLSSCSKDDNEKEEKDVKQPITPVNELAGNAVDLGLSVKWANMNVGASKPEDYGDYFAWGETKPKKNYDWSTYTLCNGSSSTMTKYCNSSSYGTVDNKTTLELVDDAAHSNWGGTWRMPTNEEWSELSTNCTWTWTTQNSVKGYLVKGPNGNSIFLPATGWRSKENLFGIIGDAPNDYGYNCTYWSSSLYSRACNARVFNFGSIGHGTGYDNNRCRGCCVRPVTK